MLGLWSVASRCGPAKSLLMGRSLRLFNSFDLRPYTIPRLQFQNFYHPLLDVLHDVYSDTEHLKDPIAVLKVFADAGAILQECYPTIKGEDGEDTLTPSPEDALYSLLDAAIERFGYAARDVFQAMAGFNIWTHLHETAFTMSYEDLQRAIVALASSNNVPDFGVSNRIIVSQPIFYDNFTSDRWKLDFKSDWVAKNMLKQLYSAEDIEIRQRINFFDRSRKHRHLQGGTLSRLLIVSLQPLPLREAPGLLSWWPLASTIQVLTPHWWLQTTHCLYLTMCSLLKLHAVSLTSTLPLTCLHVFRTTNTTSRDRQIFHCLMLLQLNSTIWKIWPFSGFCRSPHLDHMGAQRRAIRWSTKLLVPWKGNFGKPPTWELEDREGRCQTDCLNAMCGGALHSRCAKSKRWPRAADGVEISQRMGQGLPKAWGILVRDHSSGEFFWILL